MTDTTQIIRPDANPGSIGYQDYLKGTEAYKTQEQQQYQSQISRAQQTGGNIRRGELAQGSKDYVTRQLAARYGKEMQDLSVAQLAGLKSLDETEYQKAMAEKPQYMEGKEDPNNLFFGSYDTYTKALSDWTGKYQNALGRTDFDPNRYTSSKEFLDTQTSNLKQLNQTEYQKALAEKPQMLRYLNNQNEYYSALNAWTEKNKDVLSRAENYDEASKIINPLGIDLTESEKPTYDVLQQSLGKFNTYADFGDRLISQAPSFYNSAYVKGYGFVKTPYMKGTYEELDPTTMTVYLKQADVTGWKTTDNNGTEIDTPQIKESVIGSYKLGTNIDSSKLYDVVKGTPGTNVNYYVDIKGNKYSENQYRSMQAVNSGTAMLDTFGSNPKVVTVLEGYSPDKYVLKNDAQDLIKQMSSSTNIGVADDFVNERLIAENIGKWTGKGSSDNDLAALQRQQIYKKLADDASKKPYQSPFITVINPYTGRIQQGRSDTLLPKEQVQNMLVQDLIKSGKQFNVNTQTGNIDFGTGSYNFTPEVAQQTIYGQNFMNFNPNARQNIIKNQPVFNFTGQGFQIPGQSITPNYGGSKIAGLQPRTAKKVSRVDLITGVGNWQKYLI